MTNRTSAFAAAALSAAFLYFLAEIVPHTKPMKFSGAMQALQFWNAQRAYPDPYIDDRKFHAAFRAARFERSSEAAITASSDPWRPIGPHNIGGRTLAVAVNPQGTSTIYAGSASGGLWRSYTAGKGANAWHPVKTGFPLLSVSSIAIMPYDSNTILIGTGEVYHYQNSIGGLSIRTTRGGYGVGILKTTNGGATWTKTLDWDFGQLRGVNAVKIHPVHHHHVWAATSEGMFKSADSGKTWSHVSSTLMATDLLFDPADTNNVVAAHGNLASAGAGIYKTTNGGAAWQKITDGLPASFGGKIWLAQYYAYPNVIYASIGNGGVSGTWLAQSVNFGDSWTILSTNDYSTYQGWYSHFVGVHPYDSSKVITGGIDLWKSTDGGRTQIKKSNWAAWYFGTTIPGEPEGPPNYSHADHHSITYHPTDPNIIYFGNDGGVFCSTDGGETFEGRNGGYQTTQFYNGFTSAWLDSNLALGGMQDNATAIYEGTVAWRRVIGGDGVMTAMSPTSLDTMYGSSQNLSLYRSANRFATFSGMSVPSSARTNFVGPFAVSESNPKVIYAARDKVFKSVNAGVNWTATNANAVLDGNPVIAVAISPQHSDTVFAATTPILSSAKMFRTTNGGSSWTNVTGSLPNRYLIDIAIDPVNTRNVYVTASGFGTPHLYKSTDAGATWAASSTGLPDVPTSAVAVDPFNTNHVYVGNDLGVYLSTDAGGTWSSFSEGLFDATLIMDLSISRMNKSIRAVTHGNGVFERKLFTQTTSVRPGNMTAAEFRLGQNYPNPFNPSTVIPFVLPSSGQVEMEIFSSLGQRVAMPLKGESFAAGEHSIRFDAGGLSAGTYFVRLRFNGMTQMKKMIYVK